MARGRKEAQAPADTRLFPGRHLLDLGAERFDPPRERVEIGLVCNLEPDIIYSRNVGWAQNHAVAVELVPGAQIDAAVSLPAHLVKADPVDIMPEHSTQIGYADLDVAGPQHPSERHGNLPFSLIIREGHAAPKV